MLGLSRPCTLCGKTKPIEEFNLNRKGKYGRRSHCKLCYRERVRERRAGQPPRYQTDANRNKHLLGRYGIDLGAYDELLARQGDACAICRRPASRVPGENLPLHVDHCHRTGAVRGLLCASCNGGLGLFKDDPERLTGAIRYLKEGWPND